MSTWTSIATGTTCVIVTIIGLGLSFLAWRAKGSRSGFRGIAWSLLPLAMYLTHSIGLVGRIGSAIVAFGSSFVFSPKAWAGVILVGISALLFLVSGGIPLLRWERKRKKTKAKNGRDAGKQISEPAQAIGQAANGLSGTSAGSEADDDLRDVQEILRRRGIK